MKTIKYTRPNGEEIIYSVPDDAMEVREDKGVAPTVEEDMRRKILQEFCEKWPHNTLGSYPDHAPMSTHSPDGECLVCPVDHFYTQDIAVWLETSLYSYGNARYEEGVKAERERTQILLHDVIKGN